MERSRQMTTEYFQRHIHGEPDVNGKVDLCGGRNTSQGGCFLLLGGEFLWCGCRYTYPGDPHSRLVPCAMALGGQEVRHS